MNNIKLTESTDFQNLMIIDYHDINENTQENNQENTQENNCNEKLLIKKIYSPYKYVFEHLQIKQNKVSINTLTKYFKCK